MNTEKYKKPSLDTFRDLVQKMGGNLTKVAKALKCSRSSVNNWVSSDPEFKTVVQDERSSLFDECLAVSRVVALGVPSYRDENYVDENGEMKTRRIMDGWVERPDVGMLKYLMTTLGRKEEGFKDAVDESGLIPVNGVAITAWIKKENEG